MEFQSSAHHGPVSSRKILLIEDNPFWQTMMTRLLKNAEHLAEVQMMSNVEEFYDSKQKPQEFDLIIADHFLGGKTGLEFWRELDSSRSQIPFLLTSGIEQSRFLELTEEDFSHPHFLEKSLIGQHFNDRVRSLLEIPEMKVMDGALTDPAADVAMMRLMLITVVATLGVLMMQSAIYDWSLKKTLTSSTQPLAIPPVMLLTNHAPHEILKSPDVVTVKHVLSPELKARFDGILKRADAILATSHTSVEH